MNWMTGSENIAAAAATIGSRAPCVATIGVQATTRRPSQVRRDALALAIPGRRTMIRTMTIISVTSTKTTGATGWQIQGPKKVRFEWRCTSMPRLSRSWMLNGN